MLLFSIGPNAVSPGYLGGGTVRTGQGILAAIRIDGLIEATVPRTRYVRSGTERTIHKVEYYSENLKLGIQFVLIIAKPAPEARVVGDDHVDNLDFEAGLASLLFGVELNRSPYFDNYFNLALRKFATSEIEFVKESPKERRVLPFAQLPERPFGEFTHRELRALRFCSRAHHSKSASMRILLYYSALEILFGTSKFGNKLRQFYSFSQELVKISDSAISEIRNKRKEAIHYGLHREFAAEAERMIQAIVLDVVFKDTWSTYETSALRFVSRE
ncbi:MAG: hypothetical protein QNJ16_21505 [Rhodobacter sp.]|nr:hypothetical protein [Rhodobacter sp.]